MPGRDGQDDPSERTGGVEGGVSGGRQYIFRGDDNYRGGPVGRASGAEADAADIQDFADHVLRKESRRTSRYTSFAAELRVARRFTSAADNRDVRKVEMAALRELEALGAIKVWHPEEVYDALKQGPGKHRKQAAGVRAAMVRNGEVLVEGQIPAVVLEPVDS